MLDFAARRLDYQLLLIQEECGWWACRNILALPRSAQLGSLPAIDLGVAMKRLIPLQAPYNASLFTLVEETPQNIYSDKYHKGLARRRR